MRATTRRFRFALGAVATATTVSGLVAAEAKNMRSYKKEDYKMAYRMLGNTGLQVSINLCIRMLFGRL